jgi:type VI secretion system protein ImpK
MTTLALPRDGRAGELPLFNVFCGACSQWMAVCERWEHSGRVGGVDALAAALSSTVREMAGAIMMHAGGANIDIADRLQRTLAGLIDEHLLYEKEWSGRQEWADKPLEFRMFETRRAGDKLPDAIEKLVQDRDPSQRDMAAIHLACLVLGFRGRMRNTQDAKTVAQWHGILYRLAFQGELNADRVDQLLSDPSVSPPMKRPVRTSASDFQSLLRWVGLLFLALIIVTHLYWWFGTIKPLRTELANSAAMLSKVQGSIK